MSAAPGDFEDTSPPGASDSVHIEHREADTRTMTTAADLLRVLSIVKTRAVEV